MDGLAFSQARIVQTRLWSLFDNGRIDREHLDAALTRRRWAERTTGVKTKSWEIRVNQPVAFGRADGGMARRIDAAARLRAANEAFGPLRIAILEACVVKDRSSTELGRSLRISDNTARARTAEGILALTTHLNGDPVPPAPAIRFRIQPGA